LQVRKSAVINISASKTKQKGDKMKKKKNNNPFKMLGSYIGAILVVLIFLFNVTLLSWSPFLKPLSDLISGYILSLTFSSLGTPYFFIVSLFGLIITPLIIGFLIGYLVHLLIKRLKII